MGVNNGYMSGFEIKVLHSPAVSTVIHRVPPQLQPDNHKQKLLGVPSASGNPDAVSGTRVYPILDWL